MDNEFLRWAKENPTKTWAYKTLEYEKIMLERSLSEQYEILTHAKAGIAPKRGMFDALWDIEPPDFTLILQERMAKDLDLPFDREKHERESQKRKAERDAEKLQKRLAETISNCEAAIEKLKDRLLNKQNEIENFTLPAWYTKHYHSFIDKTLADDDRFSWLRHDDTPSLYTALEHRLFTLNGHAFDHDNNLSRLFEDIDWLSSDLHFESTFSNVIETVHIQRKGQGGFDWVVRLSNRRVSITRYAVFDLEVAILYALLTLIDLCWNDIAEGSKRLVGNGIDSQASEFDLKP